jgi:tRNA pseudouridine55 synthase
MAAGFAADGVLLLDKPAGITSTRALAMARRALGASKCGHTGTLDPFATGLLPLVFGEATKFSRFLIDSTKAYEATLALGRKTETGDPEGAVEVITDDIPQLAKIMEVASSFVGDIEQIPPMHSAVHVGGKRLYEYAREGQVVARQARKVHVFSLEIRGLVGGQLEVAVVCSKGTYIRVLAADIGEALGCGAYLTALRRTAVGSFRLAEAARLEDLDAEGPEEARKRLLPVEAMVAALPRLELDSELGQRFRHGQAIAAGIEPREGALAIFGDGFGFLGVGAFEADRLAPLRLVAEPLKSPDFA